MGRYFETNTQEDFIGSLRHALRCVQAVEDDPQCWKWFVLSLHSALLGACVCHLSDFSKTGALVDGNAEQWISWLETEADNSERKAPSTQLKNLPDLLKQIRNKDKIHSYVKPINVSDNELQLLKKFHSEFRNQFTHFSYRSWLIEISGLGDVARIAARIMAEILDQGYAFRHVSDEQRTEIRECLKALPVAIEKAVVRTPEV